MEKPSSFDRFVAKGVSEEEGREVANKIGANLMERGSEPMEHEKEKTPEQIEMIQLADELTDSLRTKYGLGEFSIPLENIHVFDKSLKIGDLDVGGIFLPEEQKVIVRGSDKKTPFIKDLIHELLHFKSHGALQIPVGDEEEIEFDYGYRCGFSLNSRDASSHFFGNLDEALTEVLTKDLLEKLKKDNHPLLADEIRETRKVLEEYSSVEVDGKFFGEDVVFAEYLDESHPQYGTHKVRKEGYVYEEQREVLNQLIDLLYEENKDAYSDRQEVLDLFIQTKLRGQMLAAGKLVDKTFGKGVFRQLGKLGGEQDMPLLKKYMSSLSSEQNFEFGDYNETSRLFLDNLSPEQRTQLRERKMYHVTSHENALSIVEKGLKMDSLDARDGDFEFLSELYEKYGDEEDRRLFERMVLGKSDKQSRPISLSTEPDLEAYQIPERVMYLLRDMKLLANAAYTTDEEKVRCNEIIQKYEKKFEKDENGVCVFTVRFDNPIILNQLLPEDFDTGTTSDTFDAVMTYYDVDIQYPFDIPAQYLQLEKTQNIDHEALQTFLNGRPIGFRNQANEEK